MLTINSFSLMSEFGGENGQVDGSFSAFKLAVSVLFEQYASCDYGRGF